MILNLFRVVLLSTLTIKNFMVLNLEIAYLIFNMPLFLNNVHIDHARILELVGCILKR